jgi:hypothetical protein
MISDRKSSEKKYAYLDLTSGGGFQRQHIQRNIAGCPLQSLHPTIPTISPSKIQPFDAAITLKDFQLPKTLAGRQADFAEDTWQMA